MPTWNDQRRITPQILLTRRQRTFRSAQAALSVIRACPEAYKVCTISQKFNLEAVLLLAVSHSFKDEDFLRVNMMITLQDRTSYRIMQASICTVLLRTSILSPTPRFPPKHSISATLSFERELRNFKTLQMLQTLYAWPCHATATKVVASHSA